MCVCARVCVYVCEHACVYFCVQYYNMHLRVCTLVIVCVCVRTIVSVTLNDNENGVTTDNECIFTCVHITSVHVL